MAEKMKITATQGRKVVFNMEGPALEVIDAFMKWLHEREEGRLDEVKVLASMRFRSGLWGQREVDVSGEGSKGET